MLMWCSFFTVFLMDSVLCLSEFWNYKWTWTCGFFINWILLNPLISEIFESIMQHTCIENSFNNRRSSIFQSYKQICIKFTAYLTLLLMLPLSLILFIKQMKQMSPLQRIWKIEVLNDTLFNVSYLKMHSTKTFITTMKIPQCTHLFKTNSCLNTQNVH